MRRTARFLLALAVALVLMLCFRALAFTIYVVDGQAFSPLFYAGDRVLVNRWSYGLRVGGQDGPFGYARIGRQPMERGDIVAFENPQNTDEVLICRCKAVPGDTIMHQGQPLVVPGTLTCASSDHFWMEAIGSGNTLDSRTFGLVPEQFIIGRVVMIVYNHQPSAPFWRGWMSGRFCLPL